MKRISLLIGVVVLSTLVYLIFGSAFHTLIGQNAEIVDNKVPEEIIEEDINQVTYEFTTTLPVNTDILYIFLQFDEDNKDTIDIDTSCKNFIVSNNLHEYKIGYSTYAPMIFINLEDMTDQEIQDLENEVKNLDDVIEVVIEKYQGFTTH